MTAVGQSEAVPQWDQARLNRLVRENFNYVWRLGRRLGLSEAEADDVAQQVFLVASRRLGDLEVGHERPFLYGTAVRCASKWRRTEQRRREDLESDLELVSEERFEAEELLDRRKAQAVLDDLLDQMPLELRVVFVLYEIEQQTTQQIAEVLGIPLGTVASRLRRAREDFSSRVARLEAKRRFPGGNQ